MLLALIFGYYGFYNKDKDILTKETFKATIENDADDYFVRNQECLKYKDKLASRLEATESSRGESSLEQIFYSPTVNSCLYVRYTDSSLYSRNLYDIRSDGGNSIPLEQCFALHRFDVEARDTYQRLDGNLDQYYKDLAGCDNFDEKIEGYK